MEKLLNIKKSDILFKEKKFNQNTRFDFFIKKKKKVFSLKLKM